MADELIIAPQVFEAGNNDADDNNNHPHARLSAAFQTISGTNYVSTTFVILLRNGRRNKLGKPQMTCGLLKIN